ncbi:MAG: DegT/DnrJ/EryC1/StrS family aminotransferase [Candidatus Helarchaeota archaeon]|nr:DegT/DnrJ/EryC1/StrS family aminotransferase [Candidatus Helarchaeota archaeon]
MAIPPDMDQEEIDAVVKVLKSKKLTALSGRQIKKFEKQFAKYCGTKYAVAVNSGTAAIHVALAALEVGPGDEVIVPPYTFVATVTPVLHNNAIPIFADIDKRTYCIDPEDIEKRISDKTVGIIPVHLFGHPAEMDTILEIAQKHNLFVLEDSCQAHGAEYKGKKVGSIGIAGCFSFFESKNMMTGEGGIITTNDKELLEKARLIRWHGEPAQYRYKRLGYNYRMTEIQAALGLVQLKKLDRLNEIRIKNAEYLNEKLEPLEGIQIPYVAPDVKHVFHGYAPLLEADKIGISNDEFMKRLQEFIPFIRPIYPDPLYTESIFIEKNAYKHKCPFSCPYYDKELDYSKISLPIVEEICERIIGLPTMPGITEKLLDEVIKNIRSIIEEIKK